MPDWIAHVMLGWSVAVALRINGARRVVFLAGNVMPDIVRFLVIIADLVPGQGFTKFIANPINVGSHSIIGIIVYALFFSCFFKFHPRDYSSKGKLRRWHRWCEEPFFLLLLGGIVHLFLDTFMWPWAGGVSWLYPLSGGPFSWSFKATWPGSWDAMLVLLPLLIGAITVESIARARSRAHAVESSLVMNHDTLENAS